MVWSKFTPNDFLNQQNFRSGPSRFPSYISGTRFALEALAFGGMVLVILYLMAKSGRFADVIPIIALYAYAGYRLLPALQQIYGALTMLRFSSSGLKLCTKS